MLMYNISMGIVLKEEQKGFTIIEVMLFLALSGFLLAGILVGTGSSIANQRYKDAVQDAADALRKAYSFVSDTQIGVRDGSESACKYLTSSIDTVSTAEAGRGRSSCAVYGAVVTINKDSIQTTTLIGKDYHDMLIGQDHSGGGTIDDNAAYEIINDAGATDIQILQALQANNLARHCSSNSETDCTTAVAGGSSTQKLKWGAIFKQPNANDKTSQDLAITLLIFRSPRDGSIRTLVMDDVIKDDLDNPVDYAHIAADADPSRLGVYRYLKSQSGVTDSAFKQKEVFFCIDSGGAESYADHARIIRIVKNAHSQTGIILEDMDADITNPETGDPVSCDK